MNTKKRKGPQPFWLSARARRQLSSCLSEGEINSFCLQDGEVIIDRFIEVVTPRNKRLILGTNAICVSIILLLLAAVLAPKLVVMIVSGVTALAISLSAVGIVMEHRDNVRRAKALGRVYGLSTFKPYRYRVAEYGSRYRGYFEFRDADME